MLLTKIYFPRILPIAFISFVFLFAETESTELTLSATHLCTSTLDNTLLDANDRVHFVEFARRSSSKISSVEIAVGTGFDNSERVFHVLL